MHANRPSQPESRPLVLDLNDPEQYGLFRRLFYGRFARRWAGFGLDPDDTFQELSMRVVERQDLPSRYDPTRGGLSGYLFTFIKTAGLHILDRHIRLRQGCFTTCLEELVDDEPDGSVQGDGGGLRGGRPVAIAEEPVGWEQIDALADALGVDVEALEDAAEDRDVLRGAMDRGEDLFSAFATAKAIEARKKAARAKR